MKRCNQCKARWLYTDCPITELGDKAGVLAPIRQVEALAYDGNKYCKVRVEDVTVEIKGGYLYHIPGRAGNVRCLMHDDLLNMLPLFS